MLINSNNKNKLMAKIKKMGTGYNLAIKTLKNKVLIGRKQYHLTTPKKVVKATNLNTNEKYVLADIITFFLELMPFYKSNKAISKDLGIARSTAHNCIHSLANKHYISVHNLKRTYCIEVHVDGMTFTKNIRRYILLNFHKVFSTSDEYMNHHTTKTNSNHQSNSSTPQNKATKHSASNETKSVSSSPSNSSAKVNLTSTSSDSTHVAPSASVANNVAPNLQNGTNNNQTNGIHNFTQTNQMVHNSKPIQTNQTTQPNTTKATTTDKARDTFGKAKYHQIYKFSSKLSNLLASTNVYAKINDNSDISARPLNPMYFVKSLLSHSDVVKDNTDKFGSVIKNIHQIIKIDLKLNRFMKLGQLLTGGSIIDHICYLLALPNQAIIANVKHSTYTNFTKRDMNQIRQYLFNKHMPHLDWGSMGNGTEIYWASAEAKHDMKSLFSSDVVSKAPSSVAPESNVASSVTPKTDTKSSVVSSVANNVGSSVANSVASHKTAQSSVASSTDSQTSKSVNTSNDNQVASAKANSNITSKASNSNSSASVTPKSSSSNSVTPKSTDSSELNSNSAKSSASNVNQNNNNKDNKDNNNETTKSDENKTNKNNQQDNGNQVNPTDGVNTLIRNSNQQQGLGIETTDNTKDKNTKTIDKDINAAIAQGILTVGNGVPPDEPINPSDDDDDIF